jgi:hypothetical protein
LRKNEKKKRKRKKKKGFNNAKWRAVWTPQMWSWRKIYVQGPLLLV